MPAIDLSTLNPEDYTLYFIDSNIWLAWFQYQRVQIYENTNKTIPPLLKPENEYIDYLIFLDNLIAFHENPQNKSLLRPKILFASILATEVVNVYLRKISMRLYNFDNSLRISTLKDYRNNSHYKSELGRLVDDMLTFKHLCVTVDDKFQEDDFFNTIKQFIKQNDFNDFFYMNLCRKCNCPIITHDGGFTDQDITILTRNKKLLARNQSKK
jgi:hypothetical protein